MVMAMRNAHIVSEDYWRRAMTDENVFDTFDTQFVETAVMYNAAHSEERLLAAPMDGGRGYQSYYVRINMDRAVGIMLI